MTALLKDLSKPIKKEGDGGRRLKCRLVLEEEEADMVGVEAEVEVFAVAEVRGGVLDPVEALLLTVFVLIAV